MRPSTLARLAAAALSFGGVLGATPVSAGWLDEPPKVYTFRLDDPASLSGAPLPLLDAFHDASVEPGALRRFVRDLRSRMGAQPEWRLTWASADGAAPESPVPLAERRFFPLQAEPLFDFDPFASQALRGAPLAPRALSFSPAATPAWLDPSFHTPFVKTPAAVFASNGFDALWSLPPSKPIPDWRCRRRPVRMARYAGESDAFLHVHCDGSVAAEAIDRLTLMARETTAPRPGELLPDEPEQDALAKGEFTRGVRLVHPRLLWIIQRISDAFPWRTIYVFSGYRHDPSGGRPKPGSHHSMHSEGRAMDIYVMGIPNATLFQLCHKLDDVGCGYYPNSKFVHVDVRRPGSGHPFWIDVSGPSEPSRYVDSWPGVIESGGLVWDTRTSETPH
jgi:hypothetical protein